jgi:Ni/Fe-hydrogenase subunit HybB-like protein
MSHLRGFLHFTLGSARVALTGSKAYYAWVGLLLALAVAGGLAYLNQYDQGLIVTNMRDQLSWGFYIGNFAFLVGVAAAAVVLVIPAYIYDWGPTKDVVLLAELMAVAAIAMCIAFVTVDIGRPEMIWHMMPVVGTPNFPYSMLTWDVLVLSLYGLVNLGLVTYLVFMAWRRREYSKRLVMPIVFLSIPLAISIHTVTAFLFVALPSRPFWNTAILAPRFIASAFTSGPALMLLVFLVLRRAGTFRITDKAVLKIGELLAYAMAVNLFLLGAEVFKEFYFETHHTIHASFQWFGVESHGAEATHAAGIAPFTWISLVLNLAALIIFIMPALRHRLPLLSVGCVLAFCGVYIEKGMGLLLPGQTPDTLGEIYAYSPSVTELMVGAGIWGFGALLFTLMVKVTMTIERGDFHQTSA